MDSISSIPSGVINYIRECDAVMILIDPSQIQALSAFKSRGGKIAVLQSYSPELAALMGIPPPQPSTNRTHPAEATPLRGGWWSSNVFRADGE